LTYARLLATTGGDDNLDEATAILDALETAAASVNDVRLSVGVRAMCGLLCQERGDLDAALSHVTWAVAVGAPGGLVRTFVDLGPPMRRLLAELARRSGEPHPYVTRLLAAFTPTSGPPVPAAPPHPDRGLGPDPIDSLSAREIAIVQLLAARLSSREIAASLGISSETVKRHTQAIYQKLMIGTRRAAVDRAQALGLLASPPAVRAPARRDGSPDRYPGDGC